MVATASADRANRLPELAKYDVLEEIGHGGMATVYRAHDPRLARDVAIKVIHPHLRDSLEAKTRFNVEAKAVAKLRHPNIVEVFDVSSEGEREQYLVVELVRGATLRKVLRDRGPMPPEVAASVAVELLAALAHAHGAGVVHRDIKPENVMVEHREPASALAKDRGDRVAVKLTDFGIAKLLDAQGVTSTGQVLGSPAHMAPEQIEGGDVDARADVFGLGVLLYECMVGHLPFEGNNPAQVLRRVLEGVYASAEHERPTIGKGWSTILDRALARLPSERFADANAMRDALLAELSSLGIASPRAELEAWLDDEDAYGRAHDAAMIERLCALGRDARARGDALEAASRFNRALAYAPHDPQLLKIVSSMHRANAWRKTAARAAPIALVSILLGCGAYVGTRAVRARARAATAASARADHAAELVPDSSTNAAPSGPPLASSAPLRAPPPAPAPPPRIIATPHVVVQRNVVIETVRPPFGVVVAIDGAPAGEANQGRAIPLDGRSHELRFTCAQNECDPVVKSIAPGEEPQISLDVVLPLKPAMVLVEGDPSLAYGLLEDPSVVFRVGVPVPVALPHGSMFVHVIERSSGHTRSPRLVPGKETRVDFLQAPPP